MEKTHQITLTERQLKLFNYFVEILDNELGNNGCNDLPQEIQELFSQDDGNQIAKEFAIYNNPKSPDGPNWPIPDHCLLYWLTRKINDQTK